MGTIQSLLDLDFYKFTMAQVAFSRYPDVPVTFGFINRTKGICLPDCIDEAELRAELEQIGALRFTPDEFGYLRESAYIPRGLFSEDFLTFLAGLRLPEIAVAEEESTLRIEASGLWPEVTFWETLVLSAVAELYGRAQLQRSATSVEEAWAEGERRLSKKIELIRGDQRVRFTDFGTRRRFSRAWQRHVIEVQAQELPEQFVGTSNVLFAKELGLRPVGTFAHEMDMILSGVYHGSDEEIRASHQRVLQVWWEQYGDPFSIALTDTYGTDFFFRDFTPEQARAWRGLRQDSGDPFEFGEDAIAFYERLTIDPRTKTIVFSDGLEVETMLGLVERFDGRIQVVFGWGTNLMNDLGFAPLSLIMKPTRSCGHPTVKLADNLDKALGEPEEIERFLRIFGYSAPPPRLGVKY